MSLILLVDEKRGEIKQFIYVVKRKKNIVEEVFTFKSRIHFCVFGKLGFKLESINCLSTLHSFSFGIFTNDLKTEVRLKYYFSMFK